MSPKSISRRAAPLLKALQTQGPGWALTRVRLRVARDLGVLERKTPLRPWTDYRLSAILRAQVPTDPAEYLQWRLDHPRNFFWAKISEEEARRFIGSQSVQDAERVLSGDFPFFGDWRDLGFPPQWRANPADPSAPKQVVHWSRIDEFGAGDIKFTWEVNRFAWAFVLSRAFLRSRDLRYAEAFWQLLEDWLEKNPPNQGTNWRCGQECSFRLMALCFAFYAFSDLPSSSPQRVSLFLGAVGAHARRIDAYIQYAVSQRNNHGISEAMALWTVGLLFPELQGAERWRVRGKRIVEQEVDRQIYRDGAYIQHSANYHRVMLHDLAWALRLSELNSDPCNPNVYEKFRLATRFLYSITDRESGWTPNYGHNDGARVLPLNDCVYPDMRPVLQCCHYLTEKQLLFPAGPWDEETAWLNGVDSLQASRPGAAPVPAEFDAADGGCYTIRSSDSWMMMRAAKYQDRPAHADELHCDLWWRGQNILCDAGTYSYNGELPFVDGFASTRYHNTVLVDGRDQMTRVSRFLWADWANGSAERKPGYQARSTSLEAAHDGYKKIGVQHRRAAANVGSETWIVVDDLTGNGTHDLTLHWLLPDVPLQIVAPGVVDLESPAGRARIHLQSSAQNRFSLMRGGEQIESSLAEPDPTRGWTSRYYGRKDPALSFAMHSVAALPARLVTIVALGSEPEIGTSPSLREVFVNNSRIQLSEVGNPSIFTRGIE